ncbi:hypothetical protein DM01DRAFT_1165393 [Hesseltinella vesiculosa]|uniref:Uncharacterized protein n=1 Tax=Hesseltinella vesiculosa TaxID=101127 RepID=A0A1X2GT87_9FUNG|nr:hypothetical protein DM01DRAFT_1165393 [Hesseltinella vesiculosa]
MGPPRRLVQSVTSPTSLLRPASKGSHYLGGELGPMASPLAMPVDYPNEGHSPPGSDTADLTKRDLVPDTHDAHNSLAPIVKPPPRRRRSRQTPISQPPTAP